MSCLSGSGKLHNRSDLNNSVCRNKDVNVTAVVVSAYFSQQGESLWVAIYNLHLFSTLPLVYLSIYTFSCFLIVIYYYHSSVPYILHFVPCVFIHPFLPHLPESGFSWTLQHLLFFVIKSLKCCYNFLSVESWRVLAFP